MNQYYNSGIYHHGILGMKWGHRKSPNINYAKESNKNIKVNSDGSKTIPTGFIFNRIGKNSIDVNKSGSLYVSYGKDDASRYVKTLGPTFIGKLLKTSGEAVQHIQTKSSLKMASDKQTTKEMASLLLTNKKLFNEFNKSIYSVSVTMDMDKDISIDYVKRSIHNPSGKEAQKLAYGVSSFLGDENYHKESKEVYNHFKNKGYDVIPDFHDTFTGQSKTGMIIINPDKVNVISTTVITKDIMRDGKKYVKSLEKLEVNKLIYD